ncbi:MAG: cytochrome c3 family protein [Proteobacteria bacterium]|nr:cytochrome c3 family protein [Pseudomonadota bacterium]MBU1060430.1 cytochrome c3 family protein [Pseudomonadota bacterium]
MHFHLIAWLAEQVPDSLSQSHEAVEGGTDTFFQAGETRKMVVFLGEQLGMKQSSFFLSRVLLFLLLLSPQIALAEVTAPSNPSSAKECALCHYRWIDTFFLYGRGSDLVPYQAEKVVAEAEICHSCHDGSVADSRARVYNDQHHPINKPPPEGMEIPEIFPLDKNGFMQCATCHTAHGVPSEMGMDKTIFVRSSNDDSGMCRQCHKDKDGGSDKGNHPIDSTKIKFSDEFRELGAIEGGRKNQVICESCHRVHGAANDKFLIDSAQGGGQLCLDCHRDKEAMVATVHDLRISSPNSTNLKGKTPAQSGICGVCHLVHGASEVMLWGRKMPEKSTGYKAMDLCVSCHQDGGLAKNKILAKYSHPYNVSISDKGMDPKLPVFNVEGRRVAPEQGILSCPTCHDPHQGRKVLPGGVVAAGDKFLRLTNKPAPELCRQCHLAESRVELTDHDLLAAGSKSLNNQGQSPAESGPCGVCHLIHMAEEKSLWAIDSKNRSRQPAEAVCLACHNSEGTAGTKVLGKRSHPVDVDPKRLGLKTTLPLYDKKGKKGETGMVTCLTCHNPHQWDPTKERVEHFAGLEGDGKNSFLRLQSASAPILCANCHSEQSYVTMTDHDMNILAPDSQNFLGQTPSQSGVCGACHLVHNGENRVRLWARKLGAGNGVMDKMCKSCHNKNDIGSKKVPTVDSHPEGMLITNVGRNVKGESNYFPLFQERTGKQVTVGDISCASCHDVHRWDPKVSRAGTGENMEGRATNSFLRMQTYKLMCIDCHGLDALFRFKYYHNSKQRGPVMN